MKIAKKKALELLDKRIAEFKSLKTDEDDALLSRGDYMQTYRSSELLLADLFSTKDSDQFRRECSGGFVIGRNEDIREQTLLHNQEHLSACISHLSAYRQRVDDFWPEDESSENGPDSSSVEAEQGSIKRELVDTIDINIAAFQELRDRSAEYSDGEYVEAIKTTKFFLDDRFGTPVLEDFVINIVTNQRFSRTSGVPFPDHLKTREAHLGKCIGWLKAFRKRICQKSASDLREMLGSRGNTQGTNESGRGQIAKPLPFVSKSFEETDKEVNDFFEGMLNALEIPFITAEKYSRDNIPTKVEKLIEESDIAIVIATRRDRTEKGEEIASDWITREIGQITGKRKEYILLLEHGVKPPAGAKEEKEIIYFDPTDMKAATLKFLEALRLHGLVE